MEKNSNCADSPKPAWGLAPQPGLEPGTYGLTVRRAYRATSLSERGSSINQVSNVAHETCGYNPHVDVKHALYKTSILRIVQPCRSLLSVANFYPRFIPEIRGRL